jgi:general secretion pathway protein I
MDVHPGAYGRGGAAVKQRGFTVLEVLIALAVFVGAAAVLGATYLNIMNGYAQIEAEGDYKTDVKFARAALLAEPDLETAEKGADFESVASRHVTWKATIAPTETTDLFAITFECEINAPDLKEPLRETEHFRLLRPTWSKPEDRDKLRSEARTRIQQLQTKQASGR